MKHNRQVNSELTYEHLKKYKGFEDISEAEAEKQIEFIKRMAKVMYYMYIDEQKSKNKDNEKRP
jgi:ribosomal protein S21